MYSGLTTTYPAQEDGTSSQTVLVSVDSEIQLSCDTYPISGSWEGEMVGAGMVGQLIAILVSNPNPIPPPKPHPSIYNSTTSVIIRYLYIYWVPKKQILSFNLSLYCRGYRHDHLLRKWRTGHIFRWKQHYSNCV